MEISPATLDYLPANQDIAAKLSEPRLLPDYAPFEPRAHRWLGLALALAITAAYFAFLLSYWAPAHKGVDQNGYLVGGRLYAQTLSTGLKPASPFGFIGNMWVRADDGTNYPKYPLGLPMLYAASLKLFGSDPGAAGVRYAFLVSPIGTALAMLGVFFIARRFATVFASLVAMILFGCCQTGLMLANNPNSHGSCVGVVTWGIYFLICHWQSGSIWRGLLAGLLLGFAVTIRYTEGALGLVIALVALSIVRPKWPSLVFVISLVALMIAGAPGWAMGMFDKGAAAASKNVIPGWYSILLWSLLGAVALASLAYLIVNFIDDRRTLARALMPTIGWLIPVGYLAGFNYVTQGTLTGYDTTNESAMGAAFTWDHVTQNWEKALRQINDGGTFFFFPLGLLGIFALSRKSMRLSALLLLWLIPGIFIYLAYYWAPDRGISYLRFFLTMFPALAVGVAALVVQMHRRAWTTALSIGLAVALASSFSTYRAVYGLEEGGFTDLGMEAQHRQQANLAGLGTMVARNVPEGSVLMAMQEDLHYLQFLGNYECFRADAFRTGVMNELSRRLESKDAADADPIQRARADFIKKTYDGKTERDLILAENEIMDTAFSQGRKVFLVVERDLVTEFARKFLKDKTKYGWKVVASYNDMPPIIDRDDKPDDKKKDTNPWRFGRGGRRNAALEKQVRFQIIEVTKAAASTTQPTTRPATTRPVK